MRNLRVLGLDPGLRFTGWGCVELNDSKREHVNYIDHGVVSVPSVLSIEKRLKYLYVELVEVVKSINPAEIAIEEVFVNNNGNSTMKLCMARGVVMLVPAMLNIDVTEYSANCIKKTVTGNGHADKIQVRNMVRKILSMNELDESTTKSDSNDALAAAICHVHHMPL
ncbi:MAG: crossover junction endodeoxyribonuclease RuvC [Holosporales bacterium]|jgi:crossover junction endodeoxyribonuclease RuvC|nr:crossover junction endodeoxyribonuclease RuvC [Holosporales bacterium]